MLVMIAKLVLMLVTSVSLSLNMVLILVMSVKCGSDAYYGF